MSPLRALLVVCVCLTTLVSAQAGPGVADESRETVLVSVSSLGNQGDADSGGGDLVPVISANRRYVVFASSAGNLVPNDNNGARDVFIRDLVARTTIPVSVRLAGQGDTPFGDTPLATGNGESGLAAVSADGRFVAFESSASDLVAGDTNNARDIFVRDMVLGVTTWASRSPGGEASRDSRQPSISYDGRYVAFASNVSDLVDGDSNHAEDVFVVDRQTGTTIRASVNDLGEQANRGSSQPVIAATSGGRFVAFTSDASNLHCKGLGASRSCAVDKNVKNDVFVHDLQEGTTRRISVGASGEDSNDHSQAPSISADGASVAFESSATNLVPGGSNGQFQVYVKSPVAMSLESRGLDGLPGNGPSTLPSLSAAGTVLAFQSSAKLTSADNPHTNNFLKRVGQGSAFMVSVTPVGAAGNAASMTPSVAPDGLLVVFASTASDLVPLDVNGLGDIFVHAGALSTCSGDRSESGVVSGLVHDTVEPIGPGAIGSTAHGTSCDRVAPLGL